MPPKNIFSFKSVLLVFGILWKFSDTQVNREEANQPPDGPRGDGNAFYALRSCQQLLQSDAGEFFSPDYLCSNPPLWCNWTIQVDPAKRIHLDLEDLTPVDTCHLKEDQVHLDEPIGHLKAHKVLQKCWREAKYTSSSNTLYVVQLIGGWPSSPYRGFYGRYKAFGPPVVYNPQEGFPNRESEPSPGIPDFNERVKNGEQLESEHPSPASSDLTYDYFSPSSDGTEPEEAVDTEVDENHHPVSASTQGTSRSGRGASKTPSRQSDSAVPPASSQQQRSGQSQEPLKPATNSPAANVEEASTHPERASTHPERASTHLEKASSDPKEAVRAEEERLSEEERLLVEEMPNRLPSLSEAAEPEETEPALPQPNMVEPLSDHRGNLHIRNHSEVPHLPGDHLFEVTVEVKFILDVKESWDNMFLSLLPSVKELISKQLKPLHMPLSIKTKRKKRLSAGGLYIIWLQIGQGPEYLQVHQTVHSNLHGLAAMAVGGSQWEAVISSVSIADVNECGTQMVLCDVNAYCVNRFGSYSCHCRPGFRDESRLGSGGTACVDEKPAGCSSDLSPETKGVYGLFFLLSSLILLLLAAAGLLYHRHRRGAFLVRCHSSGSSIAPPDPNNNNHHHRCHHRHHHDDTYSSPPDSDLPPPPPPARSFREGWPPAKERSPALDLQLLRFSQLLRPDAYTEPQEGGKK
ncbi:uncharacterized protein zgc:66455 isoform X2 [Sander lucioperca]|uniref:Uncharacterized LOC116052161 n=1 Tax=Sander lucioperca TaxID=283035 RepID=A0A8C9Y9S0_SANLU|nr:uncharacterized protein zgc:66455 isoform X2 [Sander lucioperca]